MRQVIFGIVLAVAASFAAADTVVTKDGRELHGRIVQHDDDKVIIEVSKYGANMQVSLPKTDVLSVKESPVFKPKPTTKPAAPTTAPAAAPTTRPTEATYFVIPIKGEIGKDVLKENIQEGLRIARIRKADYVVYEIDSCGGSVGDAEEILGVMTEKNDMHRVALVVKALSSAAVLTMACTDIYMEPAATIVAAVPVPAPGAPAIDEKILSAIRAMARSSAELGGHNVLFIQGMMEPELELGLQVKDNKPVVEAGRAGKVIKEKGKILTLTAQESVTTGLARDVVADDSALGKSLGAARWNNITAGSKVYAEGVAAKQHAKQDRETYLKGIQPQLDKIQQDLEKVDTDLVIAEANKAALGKQYDGEMASAKAQFDQAMTDAMRFRVTQSAGMQAQARAMYVGSIGGIQARFQGMGLAAQDSITKLKLQKQQLLEQKRKLMCAAPKAPR